MGVLYARVGGAWQPVGFSATDRWNTAWGQIAVNNLTLPADGTTVTNLLVLCGANNVTLVNGRRYRVTFQIREVDPTPSPATGYFLAILRKNGVDFTNQQAALVQTANLAQNAAWSYYIDGDGTTVNLTVQAQQLAGSALKVYMYGPSPGNVFSVEDIGPVSGALAITNPTPAWMNVTFTNGWSNFGGVYQTCQYRLFGDVVNVRGLMAGGTAAQSAFTLPAGFRPPARLQIATQAGGAFGWFSVDSSGQVNPENGATSAFNVNCSFSITP